MKGGLIQRYRERIGGSETLPWQSDSSRQASAGFTIVEVMIVLAVTGALFLSAVLLISGRQNKTEFTQAIQEIQSEIQQQISDVANGYYPNTKNFTCNSNGSTLTITGNASGNASGTNAGCVFLGKALQFGPQSAASNQSYNIFSIAGMQLDPNGNSITDLWSTNPTVVTQSNTSVSLQYGLTATSMYYGDNPSQKVGTVAFVSELGSLDNNGQLASGSQQISMYPILNTKIGDTDTVASAQIATELSKSTAIKNPSGGVSICFKSGGTNQSGLITIGGNDQVLSVTLSIKGNTTCS